MPRIKYDKAEVIADWKTGNFTERALASKYRISPTTAHNLVKGIDKSLGLLIGKQVAINQEVAELNEQEVSKFKQEVEDRTKHIQFFTHVAIKNVEEAMSGLCGDQLDYVRRAETILKGKEAVLGKTPDTAIQINNTQTINTAEFKQAAREVLEQI